MPQDTDSIIEYELREPAGAGVMREARAVADVVGMLRTLARTRGRPRREPRPLLVIMAPGFGSGDRYFTPLRTFLKAEGYSAEGYGLGRNLAGLDLPHKLEDLSSRWEISARPEYRGEASVPYLCDRLVDRIRQRHDETGLPVALVGWSLGGYLCREAARDLPEIVRSVVTLGTPVVGGPKYTRAARVFRQRGMDLDWIEGEIHKRESNRIRQPITAIYSKRDGIVSWQACIDRYSENARHLEVDAAHLGMGFNPVVWRHVLEALDATPA